MNDSTPGAIIKEALARGESALNEHDSKRFLSSLGIPVNREAWSFFIDRSVFSC
jgi:hypothetical protein